MLLEQGKQAKGDGALGQVRSRKKKLEKISVNGPQLKQGFYFISLLRGVT